MKALVFHGPGERSWDTVPDPEIVAETDAIVRIDSATICGTDLHILKGDVPYEGVVATQFAQYWR